MTPQPQRLTCYVKKTASNPDQWEGFCTQIDIPAIGDTYEEVARMMGQAVDNYIDYIHERQPDDEQRLMFRPLPGSKAWQLWFEERILQRLPFSGRQVRKFHLTAAKGIPAQLDPNQTQLCFDCKKYRGVGEFEVFHSPNSAYVWYDKTCDVCKSTFGHQQPG